MAIYIENNSTPEPFKISQKHGFKYKVIGDVKAFKKEDIEDIYSYIKTNRLEKINNYYFEFILLIEDSEKFYILTDNFGLIKKHYTKVKNNFYFGSFWEVLRSIENERRVVLNYQNIYDQIHYHRSFDDESIIKNIFSTNSNQLIIFDKLTYEVKKNNIRKLTYIFENNFSSINDQLDNFDQSLSAQVKFIDKNSEKSEYVVSLSGGLDSRIIIPYLTKTRKKITAFHIGISMNKIKTYDAYLVNKLLQNENIKFELINPFDSDIDDKVNLDILRNPSPRSNILKTIDIKNFNIFNLNQAYISGGHGGAVGGRILDDRFKDIKTKQSLKHYLEEKFLLVDKKFLDWTNFISQEYDPLEKELDLLVENNDFFNIFMHFHKSRHSSQGVFESLLGQLNFYSIYVPYVWLNSYHWGYTNLKNRELLIMGIKQLEKKYYKTPTQNSRSISNNSSAILLFQKINRKIRKSSIDYNIWWNNKKFDEYKKDIINSDSIFFDLFNKKEILEIFSNNTFSQPKENLLKLKLLIEFINDKKYLKYDDNYLKSSKY